MAASSNHDKLQRESNPGGCSYEDIKQEYGSAYVNAVEKAHRERTTTKK